MVLDLSNSSNLEQTAGVEGVNAFRVSTTAADGVRVCVCVCELVL